MKCKWCELTIPDGEDPVKFQDNCANGPKFNLKKHSEKAALAGHPGYLAELDSMKELHRKKASDYGTDQDPFANIRGSVDAGVEPARAAWVRALDKVRRINKHFQGSALVNESVEDSLKDLAAYSLICLTMMKEKDGSDLRNGTAFKDYSAIKALETESEEDVGPPIAWTTFGIWPPPQGGQI